MEAKQHIRKFFIIGLWLVAGAGVMALLIAAIRIKGEKICRGYEIEINGKGQQHWFIDKKDVVELLTSNGRENLTGKTTRHFDLKKMETRLEQGRWIEDAELFFDNREVLQVKITERIPIARIITSTGSGFYIDSNCVRLPLSEKMPLKLPVFTGFPSDRAQLRRADKLLLTDIRKISSYLLSQPFWMAQVSQVDISAERTFDIIPTIGNHIIEFGNGSNCEQKFRRLFVFYKQVLSKAGMEKYSKINVRYDRQVIGVKNNYLSRTDSLRFVKSIEYLIASSQKADSLRMDSIPTAGIKSAEAEMGEARSRYVKQ